MATKNPRIQVVLPPETYSAIKLAAEAVGASMSSICSEILGEAVPALLKLQQALKQHNTDPAKAFEMMADVITAAQADADQLQLDINEHQLRKARKAAK